ncbi:uncharacterized protein LOC119991634 isoform X2 [Tripterygium wilfordii]|uniref:uncharacterized protein LOC119991634 isoform X2 n=1 Tax=Tripterygium wilfordii TaxID=458696 RepID=UPI0018F85284|nr:uncharacterized protein LOC119991634 isoform X2 [Tripterygium wilfordii]
METLLGFESEIVSIDDQQGTTSSSSSHGYKLVPWLNWDEWEYVRDSLFSSSPRKIAGALRRISVWRSRGCLPVVVDVTASIVEIQLKDPSFYSGENKIPSDAIHSEQILAMLYCMAIIRLVNCVVEKKRNKREISIAAAADAIGIPRAVIDVRHEGSHRDLPALPLVRDSSEKALAWLESYYWEPQKKQIPFQKDGTANIRNDIKSKLSELAFLLREKQNSHTGSSSVKRKGKLHSSRSVGTRKQVKKTLKVLVRLYSLFSSEVVSALLEFLLEAAISSNTTAVPGDSQAGQKMYSLLDDWKLVVMKFASKEPELLLNLLKAVLDMIEAQEVMKYEIGTQSRVKLEPAMDSDQIEQLSSMFSWFMEHLVELKPQCSKDSAAENDFPSLKVNIPKAVLKELLHKCLLVSAYGKHQLMDSALLLAQLIGGSTLLEKLQKLSVVCLFNSDITEASFNLLQDESIRHAAEKLELVKLRRMKSKVKTTDDNMRNSDRWVVAKAWNPCPIGMLPRALGSSGRLPVLNFHSDHEKFGEASKRKGNWVLDRCSGRTETSSDMDLLGNEGSEMSRKRESGTESADIHEKSSLKKMRETVVDCELDGKDFSPLGAGHLMINGVWKNVGQEELIAIQSSVRILV